MTYDMAIFVPGRPSQMQLWNADPGLVVTGIVKLAQRFLLTLLTPVGSMPFSPTLGTRLIPTADQGNINSDLTARMTMLFAIAGTPIQLRAEETAEDPPDERFLDAEILSVSFTSREIRYSLTLTSLAGTTREVTLPLTNVRS